MPTARAKKIADQRSVSKDPQSLEIPIRQRPIVTSLALRPNGAMVDALRQDYRAMSVMIFGEPPAFDAMIEAIAALEAELNALGGRRDVC